MTNVADIKKLILAVFLLALFTSYTAGITLFTHIHVVDGRAITHSHPYKGTPNNPGHGHSTAQFQLIAHLSLLIMTGVSFLVISHIILGQRIARSFSVQSLPRRLQPLCYNLRAPPSFC
jgi:hypothetical protein